MRRKHAATPRGFRVLLVCADRPPHRVILSEHSEPNLSCRRRREAESRWGKERQNNRPRPQRSHATFDLRSARISATLHSAQGDTKKERTRRYTLRFSFSSCRGRRPRRPVFIAIIVCFLGQSCCFATADARPLRFVCANRPPHRVILSEHSEPNLSRRRRREAESRWGKEKQNNRPRPQRSHATFDPRFARISTTLHSTQGDTKKERTCRYTLRFSFSSCRGRRPRRPVFIAIIVCFREG